MEKKGIDVEKMEGEDERENQKGQDLSHPGSIILNPFPIAQPLSPKLKKGLIFEKKWLLECMHEE